MKIEDIKPNIEIVDPWYPEKGVGIIKEIINKKVKILFDNIFEEWNLKDVEEKLIPAKPHLLLKQGKIREISYEDFLNNKNTIAYNEIKKRKHIFNMLKNGEKVIAAVYVFTLSDYNAVDILKNGKVTEYIAEVKNIKYDEDEHDYFAYCTIPEKRLPPVRLTCIEILNVNNC